MEKTRHVRLEEIFDLQDHVLERSVQTFQTEWQFVKDCIELIINRKITESGIQESDKLAFSVVHTFLNDALSTLINSLRLALYGCFSDSLNLLRVVVEELAILKYILVNNCYQTADYELEKGLNRLKYKNIIKELDEPVIEKLWGEISELASHGTAPRLKNNRFNLNGRSLPTVGTALDSERTKICMQQVLKATIYMIRLLNDFYSKREAAIDNAFFSRVKELNDKFSSFRTGSVSRG